MPHLKSLYPDVSPLTEYLNIWDSILGQPHQASFPDYTVHQDEETGTTYTFKELKKRIDDLAASLSRPVSQGGLGLVGEKREMIGIMCDNSSEFVVLAIALLKIAVPFALISCYSTPFELKNALKIARVTRLFAAPQYFSKALPVVQEVGIPKDQVYVMYSQIDGYAVARQVHKDHLAFLFFSSGTTGLPKAVMISHGNLEFAFRQAMAIQQEKLAVAKPTPPMTPDGIPAILAFLPMHHTFGFHIYIIRAFAAPTRYIILRKWDATTVLKSIPKYKISMISMVPSMYHQIVNHPDFLKTDLSTITISHSGAAHLPQEIATKFRNQTPNIVFFSDGYGMSETTVSAIVRPYPGTLNGRLEALQGSSGVLLPGMEARIVREDGSEAGFNEVGELWLKGGNVVLGYFDNVDATRETFIDGWLRTGDHFKVNEQQYFFFADRRKDTLKISGSQVSPVEIEEVLLAHPQKLVADVTVAGVSGGRTSDEKVPHAWIVLTDNGRRLGPQNVIVELDKWHKENLSRYKWIRGGIEIVEEIPKSPTGKTLRRLLQDRYEQRKGMKSKL
ncbi:hypothetical protein AGABI1DRAFT_128792 [Agaricus bisporus var. burnettii JB137-S8]|uniref:AMP-dependent synthetase/ligase domain-containing protein n=1 Tax=Agaricus bisporus var. burnettii (strain JB137-S8 / ATCC MYA-4627 / FGSC 10392) TaxID=597362 RepID=K5WW19_AGABU|nr:uncharacterized protein AGABI1DRAFT_128792 [Agaricus bisporus var. burnettii JB137-S8]EKM79646.1 hypothetical protein AGABI1DRAFT_128792 [Agaricus bisporus var. burnettii JB137-S8]